MKADRSTFIGGSDAAAIIGVSPWTTQLDLYWEKIGDALARKPDPAKEKIFKRGKRMEPLVIDMLIDEYPLKVTKRSRGQDDEENRYWDAEFPFLSAEIDFEWEVNAEMVAMFGLDPALIGTIQNGEIKTVHPFASAKFGEMETDEIPIEYAAQAMHNLMVSNRQLTLFGVLVGSDNLSIYWIKRDEETIKAMRAKEVAFWQGHVLTKLPPSPVNLPDVLMLFRRIGGMKVEATPEILAHCQRMEVYKQDAKVAEESIEFCKFEIGKFMLGADAFERDKKGKVKPTATAAPGKHELQENGKTVLTVAFQSQTRIDADAVREKYPQVAAECSKQTEFFVFRPTRRKE